MSLLTTKGRYATRILVYLAMREGDSPARKQDIAEAEGISPDYVEQILARLKNAGLVASVRGAAGGFRLARDPASLTVQEVLLAAEGRLEVAACRPESCARASACVTRQIWHKAGTALAEVFAAHTIGALAEQARQLRGSSETSYDI